MNEVPEESAAEVREQQDAAVGDGHMLTFIELMWDGLMTVIAVQ